MEGNTQFLKASEHSISCPYPSPGWIKAIHISERQTALQTNQCPGYIRVKTRPHYLAPSQIITPYILEKSTLRISSLERFARTRSVSKDAFSYTSNLEGHLLQARSEREQGA